MSDIALFEDMRAKAIAIDACVMPQAANLRAHLQLQFSEAMRQARQLEPLHDLYIEWYLRYCADGVGVRIDSDDAKRMAHGESMADLLRWPFGQPRAVTVCAAVRAEAAQELQERKHDNSIHGRPSSQEL